MTNARLVRVRGVVQGVGFRPYIYRLAHEHNLNGWVLNADDSVEIHVEGDAAGVEAFVGEIERQAPPAAAIAAIDVEPDIATAVADFTILPSRRDGIGGAQLSPDLPVCERCLSEMRDPDNRRYRYPYINCTDCGPRYSIIEAVPYDRASTTMRNWVMCDECSAEYHDPQSRRFHAQPIACAACGPLFHVEAAVTSTRDPVEYVAGALRAGQIVAIKGIGGYHLACDARNASSVAALRSRKFRKERPFAVMAASVDVARTIAAISAEDADLLQSRARPIVLLRATETLAGIAPDNVELGVMLPYTPLQHLLFDAGAPSLLVMTSANRSSEPIAFDDADARLRLDGIADCFLVGERPIARRVDDSVVRRTCGGVTMLRRSRGYAPAAIAALPASRPILAVGADLKNSVVLVGNGKAFGSQYIGDLDQFDARRGFHEVIANLLAMHQLTLDQVTVVTDLHPEYQSTRFAADRPAASTRRVQHHRAHIASVLAERGEYSRRVVGIAADGTGYGDDGSIWGGEFLVGSVEHGFDRVAHLRPAPLVGGDGAAAFPVQAAVGFVSQLEPIPPLRRAPFNFPPRYAQATELLHAGVRTFATTSIGRLFDAAAALAGFVGPVSFEGQAAIWLEQAAVRAGVVAAYPFPFQDNQLDWRPMLQALVHDRIAGRDIAEVAAAFHRGVANGLATAAVAVAERSEVDTIVASGGVFQNTLLLSLVEEALPPRFTLWINHVVPPNDGGIALGQAALAAFGHGAVADA